MKVFRRLLAILGFCALSTGVMAEDGYQLVNKASTSTEPEVIEFFSYNCPHCSSLDPEVAAWLETKPAGIKFRRVPVVFHDGWDVTAKAYYIAEQLNVLDKTHNRIFHAIHAENKSLNKLDEIKPYFLEAGVSAMQFDKLAYADFNLDSKIQAGMVAMQKYGVRSVPSFVVNDRYYVDGKTAGDSKKLFQLLSTLPLKK